MSNVQLIKGNYILVENSSDVGYTVLDPFMRI